MNKELWDKILQFEFDNQAIGWGGIEKRSDHVSKEVLRYGKRINHSIPFSF
jgi:hypothetical protein